MGQYFCAVNLDKEKWLQHDFGMKMMESCWIGNEFVATVEHLLYGAWFGDRVIWAGDYMDYGRFLPEAVATKNPELTLFRYAKDNYTEGRLMSKLPYYRYLINHSKLEFVDKDKVRDYQGWRVHPLPLLTAASNGEGLGDYYPRSEYEEEYVGSWCGDCIAVSRDSPGMAFAEIIPDFYEGKAA